MPKMKNGFCLAALISIFLIALLFSSGVLANSFNKRLYSAEFKKHLVYSRFPDADSINSRVLKYLAGGREELDQNFFSNGEIRHMEDVRDIFDMVFLLLYFSLAGLLFLLLIRPSLKIIGISLFFSGIAFLCTAITFGFLLWLDFEASFSAFHSLFFEEGTWEFGSSSNLISLYPIGFFGDMAVNIWLTWLYFANFFIGAGALAISRLRM